MRSTSESMAGFEHARRAGAARQVGLLLATAVLAAAAAGGARAQDIFAGKPVYETHCASCHGSDGRATVPGTPDFYDGSGLYASDPQMIDVIKFGKNLMPGYDHVLKESEILNVIAYIRTLRR